MRQKVFISYSHADSEYAQRIYTQLTSYDVREEMIFLDHAAREGIEPGEQWQARIEAEIAEARVALFIVSQNSRNSDFINESELKPILAARDKGHKITIFWIRVVQVDPPSGLMEYQGLCNGEILGNVETLKGQRQIDEIAKAITGELNLHPSLSEQFYNRVAKIARQEYGLIIDREIAVGEKSVVYRGSGSGQTAA
ncbi:MAG: toll/interleukin-1 receptor domain-containing protein, partial [Pseudomonadota bacterium]